MAGTVEKLTSLLFSTLVTNSPVLSGNMKAGIEITKFSDKTSEIVINAPFYDSKVWKNEGVIIWTGASVNGMTDYASMVNKLGGYATHNKSMHWANRVCVEVASIIAQEIGAVVINELPI